MATPPIEDFSGAKNTKITTKKGFTSNIFRADELPEYPAAKAYNEIIKNEAPKQINHLFYDMSNRDNFSLLVLTDNHWGSISSHFMPSIVAQLIAKYCPNIYLGYNGDNRNNAINTEECVSSPLDNALSPVIELKLWYEIFMDEIVKKKTLFINSGNHDNGKRTQSFGTDILATFFAGTPYYEKYSRFSTLLTIRLKADNRKGYEDVKIFIDHGNSLKGGDGTKLDKGLKLAKSEGANVAIFGHVHQDMMAEYRTKRVIDPETGKSINDDISVIILPATMGQEMYALEERFEAAPSDLKLITIGTKKNEHLLGSTQKERRSLSKTSVYCDCRPIPNELWKFGMEEANRLKEKYEELRNNFNPGNRKAVRDLINNYYKTGGKNGQTSTSPQQGL